MTKQEHFENLEKAKELVDELYEMDLDPKVKATLEIVSDRLLKSLYDIYTDLPSKEIQKINERRRANEKKKTRPK